MEEKVKHIDEMFDKTRMRVTKSENDIQEIQIHIRDINKKLTDKVNCSNFDAEINYLKSMLTHLRK